MIITKILCYKQHIQISGQLRRRAVPAPREPRSAAVRPATAGSRARSARRASTATRAPRARGVRAMTTSRCAPAPSQGAWSARVETGGAAPTATRGVSGLMHALFLCWVSCALSFALYCEPSGCAVLSVSPQAGWSCS